MNPRPARVLPRSGLRISVALWLAVVLLPPLRAGDSGGQSTPAAGPGGSASPPADTSRAENLDSATPIRTTDPVRFTNEAASHYSLNPRSEPREAEYYFFPPDPPVLGAALRLYYPAPAGMPAPPELAAYVNEPFYPALGFRLAAEDLPRGLQQGLAAYRAAKVELQNELRTRLARLAEADASARQQELAALARAQAPRIVELEATAAQLRTDLLRGGVYGMLAGHGDWNERRSWRLTPSRDEKAPPETSRMEYEVIRASVYYQAGLSPAQRRLVREIAMEIQAGVRQAGEPASPGADGMGFFFLPETARIHVPADLPAPLARQIAAFVADKTQLKAELREALRRGDAMGGDERARRLGQLAVSQAPRIAALEEQAEGIRRGLAGVSDMPGPPAPPPLPPELAAQISAYRSHKANLLQLIHAMLAQPAPSGRTREKATPVQEQVADFNREHVAQFAELRTEKDAIREALAQFVRHGDAMPDRKSINDLLEEFENSRQEQEVWGRYRDYQAAVLLPGLSPEQRRVLFDAAIEELALPLPPGEVAR